MRAHPFYFVTRQILRRAGRLKCSLNRRFCWIWLHRRGLSIASAISLFSSLRRRWRKLNLLVTASCRSCRLLKLRWLLERTRPPSRHWTIEVLSLLFRLKSTVCLSICDWLATLGSSWLDLLSRLCLFATDGTLFFDIKHARCLLAPIRSRGHLDITSIDLIVILWGGLINWSIRTGTPRSLVHRRSLPIRWCRHLAS